MQQEALGMVETKGLVSAIEVALAQIERTMGDVYGSPAGHLEFQYTARASYALNKAFGAPIGKSFGMTCVSPAAIGVVIADAAAKLPLLNRWVMQAQPEAPVSVMKSSSLLPGTLVPFVRPSLPPEKWVNNYCLPSIPPPSNRQPRRIFDNNGTM